MQKLVGIIKQAFEALPHVDQLWITLDGHFHLHDQKGGQLVTREEVELYGQKKSSASAQEEFIVDPIENIEEIKLEEVVVEETNNNIPTEQSEIPAEVVTEEVAADKKKTAGKDGKFKR